MNENAFLNRASPQVHTNDTMAVRGKLAAHSAALPAVTHGAHAKSQSGYQPDAVSPKARCTPPLIDMFSAGRGCAEASPDVCLSLYLQTADGLNRD